MFGWQASLMSLCDMRGVQRRKLNRKSVRVLSRRMNRRCIQGAGIFWPVVLVRRNVGVV